MAKRRSGGRAARLKQRAAGQPATAGRLADQVRGRYKPLSEHDVQRIHGTALEVLETVGMGVIGEFPPGAGLILERGARLNDHGRICFPPALVEDMLARVTRRWTLHALDPARALEIKADTLQYGTAGGAVSILDFETGAYREPDIYDLYDVTRLIDTLEHVAWCYRPVIARDMKTVHDLDVNTAYALISGTTKPWGTTIGSVENVDAVIALFDMVLGGEGRFKRAPCCHMVQGAGVPPLRYARERCLIKEAAIRKGMPIMIASAPQAGATAPAALAGTVVQVVAEVLAGLMYADTVAPGHPMLFAAWPFVADLRTGAMSGGGAEQALLAAAVSQMANHYGLPSSTAAGMADAKVPDAQSGFEKAYTEVLAGLAGATMVHEAAGMHASLLGACLESFVIDKAMIGNLIRIARGITVTDDTLSLDVIREVNLDGPGHYLGSEQTIAVMETEYHYPPLSDRETPQAWERDGAEDIRERARARVRGVLASHYPDHISPQLDARIRERFAIKLPRDYMRAGGGRWPATV